VFIAEEVLCSYEGQFFTDSVPVELINCIYNYSINEMYSAPNVKIATSYGLDERGVGVRVPVGSRIFSSLDRPDRL
jgi:hypothetical protein